MSIFPVPLPSPVPLVAPTPSAHDHDRLVPCTVCPLQQQRRAAQGQAADYKAQHQRAPQRAQFLKTQLAQLEAEVHDLHHRHFGRNSEAHHPLTS